MERELLILSPTDREIGVSVGAVSASSPVSESEEDSAVKETVAVPERVLPSTEAV